METIYKKILTDFEIPEINERFIGINYQNDKINELEMMVYDGDKKAYFYFPSDIHTEAPEYWLKEINADDYILNVEKNKVIDVITRTHYVISELERMDGCIIPIKNELDSLLKSIKQEK